MNPTVQLTKKLLEAVEQGQDFCFETFFVILKKESTPVENENTVNKWAEFYWAKYEAIGLKQLQAASQKERELNDLLYKFFGKL